MNHTSIIKIKGNQQTLKDLSNIFSDNYLFPELCQFIDAGFDTLLLPSWDVDSLENDRLQISHYARTLGALYENLSALMPDLIIVVSTVAEEYFNSECASFGFPLEWDTLLDELGIIPGFFFKNNPIQSYKVKDGFKINPYAFSQSNLKDIVLPPDLTNIPDGAFRDCKGLKVVHFLPETVTSIGAEAFKDCHNLVEITLPQGLNTIEYGAFRSCNQLRKITLPPSLKRIGNRVFEDCENLESIFIPPELKIQDLNISPFDLDYLQKYMKPCESNLNPNIGGTVG